MEHMVVEVGVEKRIVLTFFSFKAGNDLLRDCTDVFLI